MLVTLGIGSMVLVVLGALSMCGLRSFLVMGNCAALDDKNRLAADQITLDLRQANRVLRYEVEADSRTLVLTNCLEAVTVSYSWSADTRTLICEKTDRLPYTCLTDCDAWEATLFQNIPQPSVIQPFLPATNGLGQPDLDQARVVNLTWRCSLPIAGSHSRTETAQALQIVLRSASQP